MEENHKKLPVRVVWDSLKIPWKLKKTIIKPIIWTKKIEQSDILWASLAHKLTSYNKQN